MLKLKSEGGRYPGRLPPLYHKQLTAATLRVCEGAVVLRIDDAAHEERWEEFSVPLAELVGYLHQRQEGR